MHIRVSYPEAVLNICDIKAAIDAGDRVGEILERALDVLDADISIKSAQESGIAHREKILGISPADTASLEDRRLEVLLRWWTSPVYTEKTLRQKLDAVLGIGQYVLTINMNSKTVSCLIELPRIQMQKSVRDMFEQMIPLDYLIHIAVRYNTWSKLKQYVTWKQAGQRTWKKIKEEVF